MDNLQKYDDAFATALELTPDQVGDALSFEQTPSWDSVGHIILVSTLEEAFGIDLAPEDIMAFKTYAGGKELLTASYGISF